LGVHKIKDIYFDYSNNTFVKVKKCNKKTYYKIIIYLIFYLNDKRQDIFHYYALNF
jgi:hypothetical protein